MSHTHGLESLLLLLALTADPRLLEELAEAIRDAHAREPVAASDR